LRSGAWYRDRKKVSEFLRISGPRPNGSGRVQFGECRLAADERSAPGANDRLENDIAKLEGKRQNTLKSALDDAREAADDLAKSLDKT